MSVEDLSRIPRNTRKTVIEIIYKAQASHLGSSLSVIEILTAVYSEVNIEKIKLRSRLRDKVILSKGHAAAALYATMHSFGLMSQEQISTYHQLSSLLQGHVSHGVEYVEHSTGALGHGPSVAVGHAIAQNILNSNAFTYVICGDGEIQEGAVWEALMYARTKHLGNLILIVDNNKISSITETQNVINFGAIKKGFEGFDLDVHELNGHDLFEITNTLQQIKMKPGVRPHVLICNTVKGKGVSFAESEPIWHYKTLNEESFALALREL